MRWYPITVSVQLASRSSPWGYIFRRVDSSSSNCSRRLDTAFRALRVFRVFPPAARSSFCTSLASAMTSLVSSASFRATFMYSLFAMTLLGRSTKLLIRSTGSAITPTPAKTMNTAQLSTDVSATTYTGKVVRTLHVSVAAPFAASHAKPLLAPPDSGETHRCAAESAAEPKPATPLTTVLTGRSTKPRKP